MAFLASVPGLLLAGPLAEETGVALWFAITGALVLLAGLLPWTIPAVRRLDDVTPVALPDETGDCAGANEPAAEVDPLA